MPKTLSAMIAITKVSKAFMWMSMYAILRGPHDGMRGAFCALPELVARIASAHCCCSGVIVAEPSVSFLMFVKLSTMAPTKRLTDTKAPTIIHAMKNIEKPDMSLRAGATPTPRTSIPAHMNSSHASPVDET